jgi:hypothetical protein
MSSKALLLSSLNTPQDTSHFQQTTLLRVDVHLPVLMQWHHGSAGVVTLQFTSDGNIQGMGWLLTYSITPIAGCVGVATLDYRRDTELDTVTGWVSSDYSVQISSGRATSTQPPLGDPGNWLTGYGNTSNCRILVKVGTLGSMCLQHRCMLAVTVKAVH